MRKELLEHLTAFIRGELQPEEFRGKLEYYLRAGVKSELTRAENKAIRTFFSWFVDFYDSARPPRKGMKGRLVDVWEQFAYGEYRVKRESLLREAKKVHQLLTSGSKR